jgi:hypothetical protein
MCNPIGVSRGEHKECGVQGAVLNLEASQRFNHDEILMLALTKAKVYKQHGMSRVINAVDSNGVQHDEPCIGKDLKELDVGRWITIPRKGGGVRQVRLRVWLIVNSADHLGRQSLRPFTESPSAHVFCGGCDVDQSKPEAYRPFSFLRQTSSECHPCQTERDWPKLKALLERLREGDVGDKELKKIFHDYGINKLQFALDPNYIPHINPITISPEDALHLFEDGLLRSEGAWLFFILCAMGLDLDRVNKAIKNYPDLPRDVRIPKIHPNVKKGITGKVPNSSSCLRMTGSQMMHFAQHRYARTLLPAPAPFFLLLLSSAPFFHTLMPFFSLFVCFVPCAAHSFQILNPLLTDAMRRHPAWLCWLKLVELHSVVIQHKLKVSDIERIDDLVLEHSQLFDRVPEYNGLKRPKHHFLTHLAMDIWRYGPPRGYWCFGFEGFNKVIKRGARSSNWKDPTMSVMRYWSCRSVRKFR